MTPWHHWPVAILALIFYLAAAAEYLLVQYEIAAYLSLFPAELAAYATGLPRWLDAAWGVGAWVGLLGALLLWVRNGLAPLVLAVALAGLVVTAGWLTLLARPPLQAVAGAAGLYYLWGSVAFALLVYLYARATHEPQRA